MGNGCARRVAARRARAGFAIGLSSLASACYNVQQTMTLEPAPGVEFQLELNDQGRVAVADKLGAEVKDVSGQLVSQTPADIVLAVRDVTYLRGESVRLQGEQVTINRDQVRAVTARKFSLARTAILSAAIAVAAGVFLGSKALGGLGGSSTEPGQNGGNSSIRP